MSAEEITDEATLRSWLNKRSKADAVAIAHRAAMRVLPLWGASMGADWARMRDLTALPMLRCGVISAVAGTMPTADATDAAIDADASADASAVSARAAGSSFSPSSTSTYAARASSSSARASAYAARASAETSSAARAAFTASTASSAGASIAAFAASAALASTNAFKVIRLDAERLEAGQDVWATALFPDERPAWFVEAEAQMLATWDQEPKDRWVFWRRWWNGVKTGEPLPAELQLAIVQGLEKADWDDPDRAAARIAGIEAGDWETTGQVTEVAPESDPLRDYAQEIEELRAALDAAQKTLAEQSESIAVLRGQVDGASEQVSGAVQTAEDAAKQFVDEFEALSAENKTKFETAVSAFTAANAVSAPVELWTAKQERHTEQSEQANNNFHSGLIAVAVLVCGLAFVLIWGGDGVAKLLSPVGCVPKTPETCKGFSFRGAVLSAGALTLITLTLWFTRLQMKVFLSERHLALDARERVAFAQTYVGLLKLDDTSEEANGQRGIIYNALFRPTSDGIVADEGGLDPSIAAAVSKVLAGK